MNKTDILYQLNKIKENHVNLKEDILKLINDRDLIDIEINKNLEKLDDIEKKYVELIEKLAE